MAIGWHFVFSHLGVIITGSLFTKSRIISKEALPDPTIIPARNVVSGTVDFPKILSTFFLEDKCFESDLSFTIPLKYTICCAEVLFISKTKLVADRLSSSS
ncbi:hypothetical protein D3C86_1725070 [compost metagenome]